MSATHSFSIAIAEKVGLREAILLNHFSFWHKQNQSNNRNYFDKHYWTYNTVKAFNEQYPYLSPKEIWGVLERLEKDGWITTGNYNEKKMDRTKWYALTEKGCLLLSVPFSPAVKCKFPKSKMDFTLWEIPFSPTVRAIPVTNTVTNQFTFSIRKKSTPTPKTKPVKEIKKSVRENVTVTEKEEKTLLDKFSPEFVERLFDKLSAHKMAKGQTYKSDYGAINSWVIEAVQRSNSYQPPNGSLQLTPNSTTSRPKTATNIR